MASLNKVQLIGNLGADPETRAFSNGGKVCNLRLACSESWKDKSTGEKKERTEWVSVAIFNENLAGIAERFLKKGSKVYIEGKLQTRKWQDQAGNDRYSTEVVLQGFDGSIILLDGAQGGGQQQQQSGGFGGAGSSSYGGGNYTQQQPIDDEIPF